MQAELDKRRSYLSRLKSLALFAKNQQDRVLDIQQTTASLAQQDYKIRRLKIDFPKIEVKKTPCDNVSIATDRSRKFGQRQKSESLAKLAVTHRKDFHSNLDR